MKYLWAWIGSVEVRAIDEDPVMLRALGIDAPARGTVRARR